MSWASCHLVRLKKWGLSLNEQCIGIWAAVKIKTSLQIGSNGTWAPNQNVLVFEVVSAVEAPPGESVEFPAVWLQNVLGVGAEEGRV